MRVQLIYSSKTFTNIKTKQHLDKDQSFFVSLAIEIDYRLPFIRLLLLLLLLFLCRFDFSNAEKERESEIDRER